MLYKGYIETKGKQPCEKLKNRTKWKTLEEVKKLKMLVFELEEPLETFDEKLFMEVVKSIQINKEDEMSVEFLGGLRFKERI